MRFPVLLLLLCCLTPVWGQQWVLKLGGSGLGNPLAVNPLNPDILYAAPGGAQMYISRNRGYSWEALGSGIPGGGTIKSFSVSPDDTSSYLAGVESGGGAPDVIVRSTDRGTTWNVTWHGAFGYYGQPVECQPAHPDTAYTMSNDTLFRSTDFGLSWTIVRKVTGLFGTWCDAELHPDSAGIMFVGDNTSGIWKTTDHGGTWTHVYTTTGEIPSIAIDHHNHHIVYAAKFGDGGGMIRSTDGGNHWSGLPTPAGNGNLWWVTTSREQAGYVYVGSYGSVVPGPFISADYGASWRQMVAVDSNSAPFNAVNYAILATDTQTVVALQANGLWKLQYPRNIHLTHPNGGEILVAGSAQKLAWSSTNIAMVRIELSTDGGFGWSTLDDSIPAPGGVYDWTVPMISSGHCRIRVSDVLAPAYSDISDLDFSVVIPSVSIVSPQEGDTLFSGAPATVRWTAAGLSHIDLAYSSDGGAGWSTIVVAPASADSFLWRLPSSPSPEAYLRIRTPDDTTLQDIAGPFSVTRSGEFLVTLHVTDGGSGEDSVVFGTTAGATDGVDGFTGEVAIGSSPVPGMFDARWILPTSDASRIDVRDTVAGDDGGQRFVLRLQPGNGGYPMQVNWDRSALGSGMFLLREGVENGHGALTDMHAEGSAFVTDSGSVELIIDHCDPVSTRMPGGGTWQLVSLPATLADRATRSVFPFRQTPAYAFSAGYRKSDTLEYGRGYWISSDEISLVGCPRLKDTISLVAGWNIVGSLSVPVAASAIRTNPESVLVTGFFGYDEGYEFADSLIPGHGYWVKASTPGELILDAGSTMDFSSRIGNIGTYFNQLHCVLRLCDAKGGCQSLFIANGGPGTSSGAFEMPPAPPISGFSASLDGNLIGWAERNAVSDFPISMTGDFSRLKLTLYLYNDEKFSYILVEKSGNTTLRETPIFDQQTLSLEKKGGVSFSFRVVPVGKSLQLPEVFSLGRNFPNPCNPGTTIPFTVARSAIVTLKVYSVLGQCVATLLNEARDPGAYDVEWNGLNDLGAAVSSGVYVVTLSLAEGILHPSERGIVTRKILLLK